MRSQRSNRRDVQLLVLVSRRERSSLRKIAQSEGVSQAHVVRQLIRQRYKRFKEVSASKGVS